MTVALSDGHTWFHWRFLYEQCGGLADGVEDPATGMRSGMRVIGDALRALYSGDIVDISSSGDLVGALPKVMDRALLGSPCPFQTYEESLTAFAGAIFGLRLDRGCCVEPGIPGGCGFYDPYGQYQDPPGHLTFVIPAIRQAGCDRLGLIIARLDTQEAIDPIGEYAIELHLSVK
ncbi:MAG: hypothetical protein JXR84_08280 [Anaerolineae bacterium]|nr:hypothetical protein [Anaerolineae bacterium]